MTALFDTQKAVDSLMEGEAFSRAQAEKIVSAIREATADSVTRQYLDAKLEALYWKLAATFVFANGGLFYLLHATH